MSLIDGVCVSDEKDAVNQNIALSDYKVDNSKLAYLLLYYANRFTFLTCKLRNLKFFDRYSLEILR